MMVVIRPNRNRKKQKDCERHLSKGRHLAKNAFLKLKRWRAVARSFAENTSSCLVIVQIRCLMR
ncbi:hypothetical protein HMPREF3038_02789 [Akkermansia sp. KLE1797]|nr:hypothetical protein HMPREF3038_02789 [Akkermansia sp. KLE1797]